MTLTVKTVVDRIEGELLVCSDDETSAERFLARKDYPDLKPNDVLLLTLEGDTVVHLELLKAETDERMQKASARLHALFSRRRS